jgi:hypothetical protein
MSSNCTPVEKLAELVAAKHQVLKVFVQLAERQLQAIQAADMTTLIRLLAAKQTLVTQLQAIEQEMAPFRGEDPDRRVWRSAAERSKCQAQAEAANALLAKALALEQEAETAMLNRRDAAAAALTAVQTAADARQAYAPVPTAPLTSVHVEG